MRIIVVHGSPDLDAITSVWLLKRFLPGWEDANIQFVPAGERIGNLKSPASQRGEQISRQRRGSPKAANLKNPIEQIGGNEVIHADTGLGPLDHHQTADTNVCAASLTFDFVKKNHLEKNQAISKEKLQALARMVKVIVDVDHFKEVFWKDATADYHEFSLIGILDGLKVQKPDQDGYYVDFIVQCLDAVLHEFENRIWAEREIAEKGKKFETRFGRGIGFETINDTVIKLSQKMGYVIVIRKDPRKGYVRIKAKPLFKSQISRQRRGSPKAANLPGLDKRSEASKSQKEQKDIDLTLIYEKLKKIDPDATWFLHIGKKMLLNGSVKNPKMRPTKLSLDSIIKVLEKV